MSIRLTLICHAATQATRKADFPADEPLEPSGHGKAAALAPRLGRVDGASTSPSLRAVQTAAALDLSAKQDDRLADIGLGRWAGLPLAEVQQSDPQSLALWMTDPAAAPHGGESVLRLLDRVGAWLDDPRPDGVRLIAVTHASFIRAAILIILEAAPTSFWRIDVPPLCLASFHGRPGRWTLRSCGPSWSQGEAGRTSSPGGDATLLPGVPVQRILGR